jgi:hypothetical protein
MPNGMAREQGLASPPNFSTFKPDYFLGQGQLTPLFRKWRRRYSPSSIKTLISNFYTINPLAHTPPRKSKFLVFKKLNRLLSDTPPILSISLD